VNGKASRMHSQAASTNFSHGAPRNATKASIQSERGHAAYAVSKSGCDSTKAKAPEDNKRSICLSVRVSRGWL
jgi:hypothetical protein